MRANEFPAWFFSGRDGEAAAVVMRVDGERVVVEATDGTVRESEPLTTVMMSEPFDHAPRLITLRSGGTLEVEEEGGRLARALARAGVAVSPVVQLRRWWPAVLVALAGLIVLVALAYLKGLPLAARWVADRLPAGIEGRLGDRMLVALDRHYLGPSQFDAEWRERLARRFADAATKAAPGVPYRLEFRATSEESINAFALPGGVVIVLDGLVRFAGDEAAILGVLGHELGHVAYRHSTRQVLQSVGVGMLAGMLWGDFSGTAASVPLVLGVLKYSRGFEREADDFAIAFLRANEISIEPFYDVLVRLVEREGQRGIATLPDFISTHPSLAERIEHVFKALDE